MNKLLLFLFLTLIPNWLWATHNRAGEITYRHLSDFTYEVTFTTFTKASSVHADRPSLIVFWGDSQQGDTIPRQEKIIVGPDIQKNTYVAVHQFIGPGSFIISLTDPNRNAGIENIPNSIDIPFHVETRIVINPFLPGGHNNSVQLLNPPIDNACLNKPYIHNPGAFDPDADSISYELYVPQGLEGNAVPLYQYPDEIIPGANNSISLDQRTGDFYWDSPQKAGEYNIAIRITEYRNGIEIGYVNRDMQITVGICSNNPPVIQVPPDTCVIAEEAVLFGISALDPDGEAVTLSCTGEFFEPPIERATFNVMDNLPAYGELAVQTFCQDVRLLPYRFLFKAVDEGNDNPLADVASFYLTVIGSPPQWESAIIGPAGVQLNWLNYICPNHVTMDIYRKKSSRNFVPAYCETGLPESMGYTRIAQIDPGITTYLDAETEPGHSYCYRLVATFPDGAESIVSEERCAQLDEDALFPTKASVGITDPILGLDTLGIQFLGTLDTLVDSPPPYTLNLRETTSNTLVNSESGSVLGHLDTLFESNIGTDNSKAYQFELISNARTQTSPLFAPPQLVALPSDQQITLQLINRGPWVDSAWTFLGIDGFGGVTSTFPSNEPELLLTGLTNDSSYCFVGRTYGTYPGTAFKTDNHSDTVCATPVDNIAPCFPEWELTLDCDSKSQPLFTYSFPAGCAEDLQWLQLWGVDQDGNSAEIERFSTAEGTFSIPDPQWVCFSVQTQDFNGNQSAKSAEKCIFPCPGYDLPDILSPNGDGVNDIFRATTNRFIESIDLRIWNRWEEIVFESKDPNFGWDGTHYKTGNPVVGGTYFYGVQIFFQGETGLESFELKGFVTLLRE